MLKFEKNDYTIEEVTLCGETIRFRAFRDLIYVEKPVNEEFQKMNLFVPECYYEGASLHGYDLGSAPVLMPNTVGGYMPGPAVKQIPVCLQILHRIFTCQKQVNNFSRKIWNRKLQNVI